MTTTTARKPPPERVTAVRVRRRNLMLTLFLLTSFVVGVASMGHGELYPFASWSMYSTVPGNVTTYTVRLISVGGRPLREPVSYAVSQDVLGRRPKVSGISAIHRFGKSLAEQKASKAERLRRLIEKNYLGSEVEYEVFEERYWPLERWQTGRMRERRIASFTSE